MNTTTLGQEIATKLDWEGDKICEAFLEALTDANYHALRKQIEKVIDSSEEFL